MADPLTYIFVHVPKAAGTSLRDMLRGRLVVTSPSSIFHWHLAHGFANVQPFEQRFEALSKLTDSERQKVRLVYHHGGFGMHDCFTSPYTYLSVVREPVSRSISAYYYMRQLYLSEGKEFNDSLEEMITSGRVYDPFYRDNLQVRMLAATDRSRDAECGQPCTRKTLERAKENVEKYVPILGLTEQFDEYMLLLCRHYGWRFPYYARMNENKGKERREKVRADLIDQLRESNAYDIEFYEWAKQRFENQVAAFGPTFDQQLARYRSHNRAYDRTIGSVLRMGRRVKQIISHQSAIPE